MKRAILFLFLLILAVMLTGCSCKHEDIQLVGAYDADCTQDGYTGDYICQSCQSVILAGTVFPALGHTESTPVFATESSCRIPGYSGDVYCLRCLTFVRGGEYLPLGDHVREEPTRGEPTCESSGWISTVFCRDCNAVLEEEVFLPALGHNIPDVDGYYAANCIMKGFSGNGWCVRCDSQIKGHDIDYTPHPYDHGLCTFCYHQQPGLFDENDELKMSWDELVENDLLTFGSVYSMKRYDYVMSVSDQLTGTLVLPAQYDIILYSPSYWGELVNQGMECNLTRIVIPRDYSSIEYTCLHGLTNLEAIEITCSSVHSAYDAFSFCPSLKEIIFADTLSRLAKSAFMGDSALESIDLPDGLQYIGEYCFADCTALKEITLPAALENISQGAFAGCTSLRRVVVNCAPKTVYTYDPIFRDCPALEEIVFAKNCNENSFKLFDKVQDRAFTILYEGTKMHWRAMGGDKFFPNANVTFNYTGESISR